MYAGLDKVTCVFLCFVTYVTCKDCILNDECSCTFDDGSGKVDLTSLGNTDDTPRFKDVLYFSGGNYYSYNPCGGFTEGNCSGAAVCVLNGDKSKQEQIGDATKAVFQWDDVNYNVIVAYTSGSRVLRLTTVNLKCDPSACTPTFAPEGEQGAGQFEMTMTTVCACAGMCDSNGPTNCPGSSGTTGGLSGGSILLIAFFCIVVVYFVTGVLFMIFKNQAFGNRPVTQ